MNDIPSVKILYGPIWCSVSLSYRIDRCLPEGYRWHSVGREIEVDLRVIHCGVGLAIHTVQTAGRLGDGRHFAPSRSTAGSSRTEVPMSRVCIVLMPLGHCVPLDSRVVSEYCTLSEFLRTAPPEENVKALRPLRTADTTELIRKRWLKVGKHAAISARPDSSVLQYSKSVITSVPSMSA